MDRHSLLRAAPILRAPLRAVLFGTILAAWPAAAQEPVPAPAEPPPAAEAPPADAGPQTPPPPELVIAVSGWNGGAFVRPDNRQFSHCGISRQYDNGVRLMFSLNLEQEANIGLINENWELADGYQEEARFRLDNSVDVMVPALAAGPKVLVIPTGNNEGLLEALRRGNAMRVTTSQGDFTFALTGTSASLTALQACVAKAAELIAAAPETAPEEAPRRIMSQEALLAILGNAGVANVELVAADQVPQDERELVYMWNTEGAQGGLHQSPRGRTVQMDDFAYRYMRLFEQRCVVGDPVRPGIKRRTLMPPVLIRDVYATEQAVLECEIDGAVTVASLLFTLDDYNYSVFYHQAPAEQRDVAEGATGKLADYVVSLASTSTEPPAGDAPAGDAPVAVGDPPAPVPEQPAPAPAPEPAPAPAPAPAEPAPVLPPPAPAPNP